MLEASAFLNGIATCGCWGIGAFFLRYWSETRDRFFLLFGCAFLVLSMNWVVLAIWQPPTDTRHFAYLFRLAAYVLIIAAIWDKNRPRGR